MPRLRIGPLLIPAVVAGILPALLSFLPWSWPEREAVWVVIGILLALVGLALLADAVTRVYLLQATPLGDLPPERLVTAGGYRFVRNPMTIGMVVLLIGESLLYAAPAIIAWAGVVLLVSVVTTRRIEEPGLVGAFGRDYQEYVDRTPAWIPVPNRQQNTRRLGAAHAHRSQHPD